MISRLIYDTRKFKLASISEKVSNYNQFLAFVRRSKANFGTPQPFSSVTGVGNLNFNTLHVKITIIWVSYHWHKWNVGITSGMKILLGKIQSWKLNLIVGLYKWNFTDTCGLLWRSSFPRSSILSTGVLVSALLLSKLSWGFPDYLPSYHFTILFEKKHIQGSSWPRSSMFRTSSKNEKRSLSSNIFLGEEEWKKKKFISFTLPSHWVMLEGPRAMPRYERYVSDILGILEDPPFHNPATIYVPIDYKCEDGRLPVLAGWVTISNSNSLSSSETRVTSDVRSW